MLSSATGRFKTSYAADAAIQRTPLARIAFWGGLVVAFVIAPQVLGNYWLNNLNAIWIAVVGAVGLNILLGYCGQISLGQGAFAMAGAFSVALMYDRFPGLRGSGWELWVTLPTAGAVGALVGAVFGIPSVRVKGLYLAIATLAAHPIMDWTVLHLLPRLTVKGSAASSLPVPRPTLNLGFSSFVIRSDADRYYLFGFLAILGLLFAENLVRTRIGRAWVAIRDNELAAQTVGVNLYTYKLMAFALGAFYAGVSGAMVAYDLRAVTNEAFGVDRSIEFLAMVIIGGLGSIPGPILGSAFIVLVPIVIRDQLVAPLASVVPRIATFYAFVRDIIFGVLIIAFVILEPQGLYSLWRRVKNAFRLWPFSY